MTGVQTCALPICFPVTILFEVKMTVNRIEIQTRNHGDAIYEEMADVRKETRKEIEVVKEDIIAVKAFVGMKA